MERLQVILDMNKILLGVVVSLLSWNVYATHLLKIDVAVLSAKVESQGSGEDVALLKQRVTRLEAWQQNLSNRLSSLEEFEREN